MKEVILEGSPLVEALMDMELIAGLAIIDDMLTGRDSIEELIDIEPIEAIELMVEIVDTPVAPNEL